MVQNVARQSRVLGRRDPRKRIGQHRHGPHPCGERGPVGRRVDAEGQPADDAESRNPFGQPFDQPVAHVLAVGRRVARPDDRNAAGRQGFRIALNVQDMGVVGRLPQQGGVLRVGRCDGCQAVAAAVLQLPLRGRKPLAAHDLPGCFGPERRPAGQFLLGRGEDPRGAAETLQEVHGALHADSRGHLQCYIFGGHGSLDSFDEVKVLIFAK